MFTRHTTCWLTTSVWQHTWHWEPVHQSITFWYCPDGHPIGQRSIRSGVRWIMCTCVTWRRLSHKAEGYSGSCVSLKRRNTITNDQAVENAEPPPTFFLVTSPGLTLSLHAYMLIEPKSHDRDLVSRDFSLFRRPWIRRWSSSAARQCMTMPPRRQRDTVPGHRSLSWKREMQNLHPQGSFRLRPANRRWRSHQLLRWGWSPAETMTRLNTFVMTPTPCASVCSVAGLHSDLFKKLKFRACMETLTGWHYSVATEGDRICKDTEQPTTVQPALLPLFIQGLRRLFPEQRTHGYNLWQRPLAFMLPVWRRNKISFLPCVCIGYVVQAEPECYWFLLNFNLNICELSCNCVISIGWVSWIVHRCKKNVDPMNKKR